jgi:O-antigen biosynthesis protein
MMLDEARESTIDVDAMKASVVGVACFGRADQVESASVTGWFVAPGRGPIVAFIDGEAAGQAVILAAASRPVGTPEQARGFSYAIPLHFQDGRSHVLCLILEDGTAIEFRTRSGVTRANMRFRFEQPSLARVAAIGADLNAAARVRPNSAAGNSDYTGFSDPFSGTTITGWAIRRDSPGEPVRLRMFVDGHAAGIAVCDQPREELRTLGLPEQFGGFSFDIPEAFLDGVTHSLSVILDDGSILPFKDTDGEPQNKLEFTAEPITSIDGVVDGLNGDSIRGWAVRKHHKNGDLEGHLAIEVMCNGIVIGKVVADQPRMDVAREYRCDPCVGFEFKLPHHCRNGMEFEFVFKALPEGEELAGCPLAVKHRSSESSDELRALADTVGELCAKAFKLQRQVREMLPVAEATVLNYDGWARRYLARLRSRMATAAPLPEDVPLVSIVMPTYKANIAHLTAAIESVRAQTYTNWELIIVDDGSRQRALNACLKDYAANDQRITSLVRKENRGISTATNAALRKATGAYVVLFDHDDLLVEVALEAMVRSALRTGAKIIYSDEDKIDDFGVLSEPNLKPDWNYRLLLGINYICHLVMIDRALLRRVGPMRSECDGAQDHDLLLRLSERCAPEQIFHLPEILYHWRKSASSTAASGEAKSYAVEAGRRAVAEHLARRGFGQSQVRPIGKSTSYSVSWGLSEQPSVTIIIPFKDQITTTQRCLELLLANTHWSDWRVVLVDNGSVTPEAGEFCRNAAHEPHVIVRRVDEPFNYSRLNNIAAREHPADYYVFLNNDVFLEQSDWLRVMMDEMAADPKVAVVGAKLLYPNGTVQHAGVVLGVGGIADHVFRGIPADHPGYLYRARCAQEYSAVTGACMLCRADVFMDVGGFDEQDLAVAFNDVDLCLKIGSRGWRIVWTPDVVAEHHESLSRGDDISSSKAQRFFYENHVMLERWHGVIDVDPHYNPHFSREHGIFTDLA